MKFLFTLLIPGLLIFFSCSASTDKRYRTDKEDTDNTKEISKVEKPETIIKEDFDFSPFRTKLNLPDKKVNVPVRVDRSDIWYGYEETEPDTSLFPSKKIIDKVPGYRVLLLTTDNLEEANNLKAEIDSSSSRREVYVVFDPPFYKVMVGDFTEYSEAKDLSFKMNQLGFTESRVVNETVNIFE